MKPETGAFSDEQHSSSPSAENEVGPQVETAVSPRYSWGFVTNGGRRERDGVLAKNGREGICAVR
jgi:hypothetical protein